MAFMQPAGSSNLPQWMAISDRCARTDDPFDGATQEQKEATFQHPLLQPCWGKERVLTNSNKTSTLSLKKQHRLLKRDSSAAY
jgi:hypothetical protein